MRRWLPLLLLLLCASPAWAQTWTELPGSTLNLSTIFCENAGSAAPPNCVPKAVAGYLLDAWVDGDYDAATGQFRSPRGGGHADGRGNQVIAFTAATGRWTLLSPASLNAPPLCTNPTTQNCNGKMSTIYPDGTPASVHTYGGLAWMPWLNRFYSAGGIYWSPGGESVPATTWWWEPGKPLTEAWTQKTTRPGGYGTYAIADPRTRTVLVRTSQALYEYDPAKDVTVSPVNPTLAYVSTNPAYRQLFSQASASGQDSARALSADGRKLYSLMSRSGGVNVLVTDRDNLALKDQTLTTTGGPPYKYGMALIADAGRLLTLVTNGTTAVLWSLDPANCGLASLPPCQWAQITPLSGPLPPPPAQQALWRKFYRDGCDYIFIPTQAGNVWRFKPAWRTDTCGGTPPAQVTLTLTATGSTGQGTLSGAGTYSQGAPATIGATPMAGSAIGPVTGDAGCVANGTITMTASKSCNIPFLDVQPPVVTLQSPTPAQLVKQPTPVTYTVTDNMPAATATVLLDGQPYAGATLDPAVLTEGSHQLVVQATDAAGNTAQAAVSFIAVNCPVCRAALTVQTAGAGTGTVTGAGEYAAGAPVELVSTPAADSQVGGIGPPPCDTHFTMPAANLTCTVTFVKRQFPLTLATSGTGTGTVTGGGSYTAGTMVAVGGSPAAGSTDGGVSPPPCSRTAFPMPASALTCVVTYTLAATTYPLSTTVVGQGTVTGAKSYAAGAPVTLTATPAAGQTVSSYAPAPCAASFAMPAAALTCTVTFVATGQSPLPNVTPRVWLGVPLSVLGESKHARLTYDSKRQVMLVGGGDGTDGSGNSYKGQYVHSLDLATGSAFVRLHGGCPAVPVAQGGIQPPRPDNVTWAYDPKRDVAVVMPAYYGGGANECAPAYAGSVTGPATTTALTDTALAFPPNYGQEVVGRVVIFDGNVTAALAKKWTRVVSYTPGATSFTFENPSKQADGSSFTLPAPAVGDTYKISSDWPTKDGWQFDLAAKQWRRGGWPAPVAGSGTTGWGGDIHDHFGVLDPVTDTVYRATNLCGMQIIPLDGSASACVAFAFAGAPAGSWDPSNDQTAIDVEGRMIYWVARYKRALVKWSIATRAIVEMLPLPATWVAPMSDYGGTDFETHLAFDSTNRVLMLPNDNGYGQGTTSATYAGTMIIPAHTGSATGATTPTTLVDSGLLELNQPLVGRGLRFEGNVTAALAGVSTTIRAYATSSTTLTFDAVPATPAVGDRYTIDARNQGVYFLNVDTKTWEWEAAPTDRSVSGNVLGYDPAHNVFLYLGRSASSPNLYWLYRYK